MAQCRAVSAARSAGRLQLRFHPAGTVRADQGPLPRTGSLEEEPRRAPLTVRISQAPPFQRPAVPCARKLKSRDIRKRAPDTRRRHAHRLVAVPPAIRRAPLTPQIDASSMGQHADQRQKATPNNLPDGPSLSLHRLRWALWPRCVGISGDSVAQFLMKSGSRSFP